MINVAALARICKSSLFAIESKLTRMSIQSLLIPYLTRAAFLLVLLGLTHRRFQYITENADQTCLLTKSARSRIARMIGLEDDAEGSQLS